MYKGKKKRLSNRSRILECIYRNAPIARTDIAEETEITPATVTVNVSALIAEGVVEELGEAMTEEISSGRKRVLIDVVSTCRYSIGVEFTLKALVICITDMKGDILCHTLTPFSQELASNITQFICLGIENLVSSAKLDWGKIIGIGIAVPGHMNHDSSQLVTNRKVWASFAPNTLKEVFPVPVTFENNARCMALGEYLFDSQNSPDSFSFFHVGVGMFCANLVEGEMFLGNHYVAGEIGHTIVCENGRRCECGKYGCLQTYSSETHMLKNARLLYENSSRSMLRNLVTSKEEITLQTIITAYSMGDPAIGACIEDALKYLGITISNIAITMNPGKIFLHGQIFENEDIRTELMDYIERQLLFVDNSYTDYIDILPYFPSDGAKGASALAISRFFIRADSPET